VQVLLAASLYLGALASLVQPHVFAVALIAIAGGSGDNGLIEGGQRASGVEHGLAVAPEGDSAVVERGRVLKYRLDTLATEAVEGKDVHQVEAPLLGIAHQLLKLLALGLAARLLVNVLLDNSVPRAFSLAAQQHELVFGVLVFVTGLDAGVQGYLHGS
jgi:hypothetical protein